MRAPPEQGGGDSFTCGEYIRIQHERSLEFTQQLGDESGNPIDPQQIGMPPDFPKIMTTEVLFEKMGSFTKLTITSRGWTGGPMFVYALAGFHQSIDKLEDSFNAGN
jgi:hypothetical protein